MDKEKKVRSSRNKFAWSPQQEQILKTWGEASACYRYMHNHAFLIYKKQNMHFSLPVIIRYCKLCTKFATREYKRGSTVNDWWFEFNCRYNRDSHAVPQNK
jgi:hypothetical protein